MGAVRAREHELDKDDTLSVVTAAAEIRSKYADAIERGELRARAESNTICELCTGEHRTSDCLIGHDYIRQIVNHRGPTRLDETPRDLDREKRRELLAEAIGLIQSVMG
jgi:uncharacterized protein YcfJ